MFENLYLDLSIDSLKSFVPFSLVIFHPSLVKNKILYILKRTLLLRVDVRSRLAFVLYTDVGSKKNSLSHDS